MREGQAALVVAKVNGLDEALVAQVVERVVVDVEVLFGHDPERADGGQRAAVLAVQLVDAVTIDDQLALLAARQVEVAHQAVARIVVVAVPLVVHARPSVVAIPLAVFARITPSSVRHRSLLAWRLLFGLSVKTPWQLLRGVIQEAPKRRGVSPRRSGRGRVGTRLGAAGATERGFGPRALTRIETAADQELLQTLYAPRGRRASWVEVGVGGSLEGTLFSRQSQPERACQTFAIRSARPALPTPKPAQPRRHTGAVQKQTM